MSEHELDQHLDWQDKCAEEDSLPLTDKIVEIFVRNSVPVGAFAWRTVIQEINALSEELREKLMSQCMCDDFGWGDSWCPFCTARDKDTEVGHNLWNEYMSEAPVGKDLFADCCTFPDWLDQREEE